MNKNGFNLKEICILIVVTAIVTSLTTGLIMYNNNKVLNGAVDINKDEKIKEFLKIYSSLNEDYYENIDKNEMIDKAIAAMLNYLGEDYSKYLNKSETEDLTSQLSGKYYGIGVTIYENNKIFKVYENTPASQAGLQRDDIILQINDTILTDETAVQVSNLLKRQEENTLRIKRGEEELEVKVRPSEINTPLTREIKEVNGKKIGYIYIPAFTNIVDESFRSALNELEQTGIDSLILDLRSNTGGYLHGATKIASMFLEKGKVIYSLENKEKTDTYKDETAEKRSYPVVILINEGTASASEILASALKESYGAVLVGQASYGKGRVQQTKSLEDGSMVKYTTARWLTPSGECIDGIGIFPNYSIPLEKTEDSTEFVDTQLNKAIELLS